jgi:periplasmic divalent cation tolerance protein
MKAKMRQHCSIVFVTVPSMKVARGIARLCVEKRLAACANLVPGIESHYQWRGKLERGKEVLMIFKTTRACLRPLRENVLRNHPYDTPEFISFPIEFGAAGYLDWIACAVNSRCGK